MWSTKQCGYCCPHRTFKPNFKFNFKTSTNFPFFKLLAPKETNRNNLGADNFGKIVMKKDLDGIS